MNEKGLIPALCSDVTLISYRLRVGAEMPCSDLMGKES